MRRLLKTSEKGRWAAPHNTINSFARLYPPSHDAVAGIPASCSHGPRSTIKAVVTVQRLFRGYLARNRVAGRREAMAFLRSACLGVAMDMIDSYIREVSLVVSGTDTSTVLTTT